MRTILHSSQCKLMLKSGFTLIELSIVLVIIGMIVGGVLTGQDLINAAAIRAQVSQIEKYNTSTRTFQNKYGCIPGDCANAATFGFGVRGQYAGEGDGNGIIEGNRTNAVGNNVGIYEGAGETAMFWNDLGAAGLVDGSFTAATSNNPPVIMITASSSPSLSNYFPQAKIGNGNYVYVYSGGAEGPPWKPSGINYFALSGISFVGTYSVSATLNLSVMQAYNIDKKVDDGFPLTGKILAQYVNTEIVPVGTASASVAVAPSANTCYDNGNSTSNPILYSVGINGGAGLNCALSFVFQ